MQSRASGTHGRAQPGRAHCCSPPKIGVCAPDLDVAECMAGKRWSGC